MATILFRAGAAKVDITPPLGTLINGDFVMHYARWVHDPLFARALILERGQTVVALVVVDICAMRKEFLDEVKRLITSHTAIPAEHILVSSTHTHAAGSVESLLLGAADLPYRQKLPGLILEAVRQAKQKLQPAKIAFGQVDAPEHVVCRRFYMKQGYAAPNPVTGGLDKVKTNPFGDESQIDRRVAPTDPQVSYLAVQGTNGEWISLLANFSLHYVGDWENGTITADYFGVFADKLQEKLKATDGFVGMMSNGTSGEANIWDFLAPDRYPKGFFAKSRLIGEDIAEKVFQSLKNVGWQTAPSLSARYKELAVPVRKPSSTEVEEAKKIVAETQYETLQTIDPDGLRRLYAREQVLLAEYPDTVDFPVQAIKIGDGVVGGLGGEFFAETGLWLKENSRLRHYFTIGLANGYVGYVPPAQEIEKGGYETWRCRTSYLEENAEVDIRTALLHLMQQLP
jgi:neutral ceramidase